MLNKIKTKFEKRREARSMLRNMPSAFDEAEISWVAPESLEYKKGLVWKISALLFVVMAVVFGLISNAWTFSLAIIAFAFAYYVMTKKEGKVVEVMISKIGIKVGNRTYPYGKIKGFWIIYEPPHIQSLNLLVDGEFSSRVVIQLRNQNPAEVREFLMEKIPEVKGQTESVTDILARLFKM